MYRKSKSIETESRFVVARNWGNGSYDCNEYGVSLGGDENVRDSGDGHITLNRLKANE